MDNGEVEPTNQPSVDEIAAYPQAPKPVEMAKDNTKDPQSKKKDEGKKK